LVDSSGSAGCSALGLGFEDVVCGLSVLKALLGGL